MTAQRNMGVTSVIIGVFSLIMLLSGLSMPFGALGIVIALLSRGAGKIEGPAKTGLVISLIGFIAGLAILVTSYVFVSTGALDSTYKQLREYYVESYGEDSEEINALDDLFGYGAGVREGGQ